MVYSQQQKRESTSEMINQKKISLPITGQLNCSTWERSQNISVFYNTAFLPTFTVHLLPLFFLQAQHVDCLLRQWKLWGPADPHGAHLLLPVYMSNRGGWLQVPKTSWRRSFNLASFHEISVLLEEAFVIQNLCVRIWAMRSGKA